VNRTPQQKLSDKQEKGTAKAYKGKQQPGSGSGWKHRQDVKSDEYLVEDKRTGKKSISISAKDWYQLRKEAILLDRIPLMDIELDGRNYTMLLRDDFIELTDPS
jgi:hypothetical protein